MVLFLYEGHQKNGFQASISLLEAVSSKLISFVLFKLMYNLGLFTLYNPIETNR